MVSAGGQTERDGSVPFHLKVFYRVGSHHKPDEFAASDPSSPSSLPRQHISISTWPSCTLRELSQLLVQPLEPELPSPAVGTRLAFRLVYPDPACVRGGPGAPARYTYKDLGSVVVGGDGMGRLPADDYDEDNDEDENDEDHRHHNHEGSSGEQMDIEGDTGLKGSSSLNGGGGGAVGDGGGVNLGGEPDKTLADARFVIGDFLSVAILPPGRNGEIAPPSAAKGPPPISSGFGSGSGRRQDADHREANGWFAEGRGSRRQGSGGGPFGSLGGQLPRGDWRRGEKLPPVEPRGYGRGRRGL